MKYTVKINGAHYKENCFPGLNDLLSEASRNPMAYGRMKRQFETIAVSSIRMSLRGKKFTKPVVLNYTFGEKVKGKRRDLDNVCAAGRKIINDALVKTGTIVDDSPKYIPMLGKNDFVYTNIPFIEVEIEELG